MRHQCVAVAFVVLLCVTSGTLGHERANIPDGKPTKDETFVGAVFDEPRIDDGAPVYMSRLWKDYTWQSIVDAAYRNGRKDEAPMKRSDSMPNEARTVVFYSKSGFPRVEFVRSKGYTPVTALLNVVTDYYYKANTSTATPITNMWPFFYHYRDFMDRRSRYIVEKRRHGVIDVDVDLWNIFNQGGIDEMILLTYSEWEAHALHGLSLLEKLPCMYGNLYEKVDFNSLDLSWRMSLKGLGVSSASLMQAADNGFSSLVDGRYPPSSSTEVTPEQCPQEEFLLLPRLRPDTHQPSSTNLKKDPLVQLVAAMRLSWLNSLDSMFSAVRFTGRTPAFSFVRSTTDDSSILLGSLRVTEDTTIDDLMRFVVRHTESSLRIHSYHQLAQLVEDYGKIAVLILRRGDRKLLDDEMDFHKYVRPTIPLFIIDEGNMFDRPPAGWDTMRTLPSVTITPEEFDDPFNVRAGATLKSQLHVDAVTIAILETPTRRPAAYDASRWTRQNILVPLPTEQADLKQWCRMAGSRFADVVTSLEASQPVVHEISGGEDLQNALFAPGRDALDESSEMLLVVDSGSSSSLTCGEKLRAMVMAGPKVATMRYGIISKTTLGLQDVLMAASTPRHTLNGRSPCNLPHPALYAACKTFCVSPDGHLSRFIPAETEKHPPAAVDPKALALEHICATDREAALQEVLREVDAVGEEDVEVRSTVRHTAATQVPWFLLIPKGQSVPVLMYDLATPTKESATSDFHFIFLTDSTCGLTANYAKAMALLRPCYQSSARSARFLTVDLADTATTKLTGVPAALLSSHYMSQRELLRPPQLILYNGTHALTTMGTIAYVETKSWLAAVAEMMAVVDDKFHWDAVETCVQKLLDEEQDNREAFRQALR